MAAVVLKAGSCCIIIPEIFQGFAFPSKKAGGQQHSTHSPMEMIGQPGGSFSLATLSGTHVLVTQQKEMEPRGLTSVQTQHHSPGVWEAGILLPRAVLPGDEGFWLPGIQLSLRVPFPLLSFSCLEQTLTGAGSVITRSRPLPHLEGMPWERTEQAASVWEWCFSYCIAARIQQSPSKHHPLLCK